LNACATAFNSSSSSNGLGRKSSAPAFIARTLIGTSPCPVIKTIATAGPRGERFLQFETIQSGHSHIQENAAGSVEAALGKKASAEEKASVW